MPYCTVDDVQNILPDNLVIGTNLMDKGTAVLRDDVDRWIEFAETVINSSLVNIYRIPLLQAKYSDFTTNPVEVTQRYPDPIPIICARLAAGHLYDEVSNANQEPDVSEWGKNQRALAHDLLMRVQSGHIRLKGQPMEGYRFVPKETYDDPRLSRPNEMSINQRGPGT